MTARTAGDAQEDSDATSRGSALRIRLASRLDAFGRTTAGDPGDAAVVRRMALFGYTAASIIVGLSLLAWTTVVVPIGPAIDPRLPETALTGPLGGTLLWTLFGFIGSLRVLRAPGGAGFVTFHLPFMAAAMILGGPTAGAWVAFLSSLERRELEQQPWYGVLANHAVFVIGAVAGGLVSAVVAQAAQGTGSPGLGRALAAVAGTLVLSAIPTAMAAVTVILRDELSVSDYLGILRGHFGRVIVLEVAIAWSLVVAYLEIAWWAPAVVGAMILMVWDNHPMPSPDGLTGLPALDAFTRRFDAGLGRLRRGLVPGATVLGIDLNSFKAVNTRYGHNVGNEVLAQVGIRLQAQARRPSDLAGRVGGDEFALFLPGMAEPESAMRRAEELAAAISQPISTSVGAITIGVSVGVVVLPAWGGVPAMGTILRHADAATYLAKRAGGGAHLYDPTEPVPFDDGRVEDQR